MIDKIKIKKLDKKLGLKVNILNAFDDKESLDQLEFDLVQAGWDIKWLKREVRDNGYYVRLSLKKDIEALRCPKS